MHKTAWLYLECKQVFSLWSDYFRFFLKIPLFWNSEYFLIWKHCLKLNQPPKAYFIYSFHIYYDIPSYLSHGVAEINGAVWLGGLFSASQPQSFRLGGWVTRWQLVAAWFHCVWQQGAAGSRESAPACELAGGSSEDWNWAVVTVPAEEIHKQGFQER